jgi:hypothetical protein
MIRPGLRGVRDGMAQDAQRQGQRDGCGPASINSERDGRAVTRPPPPRKRIGTLYISTPRTIFHEKSMIGNGMRTLNFGETALYRHLERGER